MEYEKQNFKSGDVLYASQLNAMDDAIGALAEQTEALADQTARLSDLHHIQDGDKTYVVRLAVEGGKPVMIYEEVQK